ncbi:neuronal acetylcholine receptor subunit alpha-7, partial [Elysia marginata]
MPSVQVPAVRNCQFYTCCPDEQFIDLTFTIVFQRRSAFYNYILILPCILLTSLTLVLFWIPPESPAKLML